MVRYTTPLFLVSIFIFSCAASPVKGGAPSTTPATYTLPNGRPASATDFAEVGRLRADNFRCTVFVISDDVAVTAAHCLPKQRKLITLEFSFGTYEVSEWVEARGQDIAFLHIPSIKPREHIPAMDLATDFTDILGPLSFVGYGCSPIALLPTSAPVILPRGTKRVVDFHPTTVSYFRASKDESAARTYFRDENFTLCGGDSGGPIFKTGTKQVVGVAVAALQEGLGDEILYMGSIFEETITIGQAIADLKASKKE